jgi:hypothetical protein
MQINSMAKPTGQKLDELRDWLDRDGYGNMFLMRHGTTEAVWNKEKSFTDFGTLHHGADGITESLWALLLQCKRSLTSAKSWKICIELTPLRA